MHEFYESNISVLKYTIDIALSHTIFKRDNLKIIKITVLNEKLICSSTMLQNNNNQKNKNKNKLSSLL